MKYTAKNRPVNTLLPSQNAHKGGWLLIWRAVFDHPTVGTHGRPFTRCEAWLWLIANAGYEGPERGSLEGSLSFLATRWSWSKKAVRCFLERLENEGMIERKIGAQLGAQLGAHPGAHLSICNYDKYQEPGNAQGHSQGHTQGHKTKERKESKEKKKKDSCVISAAFSSFNAMADSVGLTRCLKETDSRRTALQARLDEHGQLSWDTLLANIHRSAFLQGKSEGGWKPPGIDWFLKPANYIKVIEGAYGNGSPGPDNNSLDHYYKILGESHGRH